MSSVEKCSPTFRGAGFGGGWGRAPPFEWGEGEGVALDVASAATGHLAESVMEMHFCKKIKPNKIIMHFEGNA